MKRRFLRRALPLVAVCVGLVACSRGTTTTTPAPPTAYAVLRLSATNGLPDTGFAGGRGIVTTEIDPALFDFATAVAIQPDNKILAGGSSGLFGQGVIALVRYDQSGVLDTAGFGTAGTGGIVRTPTPAGWTSASAMAIAVQPADNKIVVAALAFNAATSTTGIALIRYKPDGTLDTTFNTTGIVIASIGLGRSDDSCALALQGTNIVVAGASSDGNVVLYRYDTNGAADTTFGPTVSGKTATPIGPVARSPAIAFQSDGRIIVASGTDVDQVVLRYSADGILDTSFGGTTDGIVKTDVGGGVNFANAVAVQSTGNASTNDKIVVAGHANLTDMTSDISLVRYTKDGALDTTFSGPLNNPNPGIVITDLAGQFDNAFSVVLQAQTVNEPLILVSGNTGSGGFTQIAVLRYNLDGTLDASFGVGGVVTVQVIGPSNAASGNAVALQPVGLGVGIVVAGYD